MSGCWLTSAMSQQPLQLCHNGAVIPENMVSEGVVVAL